MIQENYHIPATLGEACLEVLDRLEKRMKKIRESKVYQEAKSVYVRLLLPQIPLKEAEKIGDFVRKGLPKAVVAGTSVSLFPREPKRVSLRMNCSYFFHGQVTLLEHVGRPVHYKTAGRNFGHRIAQLKDVKGVELFCVGLNIDVSRFIIGVSEENEEVPLFGSLAGSFIDHDIELENKCSSEQAQDLPLISYILGDKLYETGIVMVVFSGEELHVKADYLLGWKPLGKELTVTRAISRTCVATIDNIPATEIYRRYLKVPPDDKFLENVCEFPMITKRDGFLTARTPPLSSRDGKLIFNADVHEGEKFRLSYANPDELLQETWDASEKMREFSPEAIYICACINRLLFLKEHALREVHSYGRLQPKLATCYGAGEIYRYRGKGGVLNSSFIVVGMREGECPPVAPVALEPPVMNNSLYGKTIPLSTRLATFLNATANELEESNQELKDMAAAAEAASMAKSQFLSNMSHEIRTPINAILGMDEMILREADEKPILEYAENIRLAGSNLLRLINDILDFSKIESGKLDIIPVEYALSSVLNDLVNMVQNRADEKGLCFAVKSAPEIPSLLYGDEIRLKQIITNLLTNAVKYTEHGFVFLSVGYERKSEDSILLHVSVNDTGIGIKEEDMAKLFRSFERLEEKRNRTIEGAGLGMNITRHLLELMGSTLDVRSVYGKGSTFSFALEQKVVDWKPMGDFDEAYRRSLTPHKEYREKFTAPDAHILVVDDTVMNLRVFQGLLKKTKVQIDTAESGYDCLEKILQKKYDLIFLDHRMPGLDGIETLRRMQKLPDHPNKKTPVISLTANAVSGAREEYLAEGFKDYLTKPIDGSRLESVLLNYLPPEKIENGTSEKQEIQPQGPEAASEVSPKDPALPDWLSQISDLNSAAGIGHCGAVDVYLEALGVFAESIVPCAKEIARYYENEDWKNFTTKVHALKSTARIIGAEELSERARCLEDAGNKGDLEKIRNSSDELLQLYLSYAFKLAPLCKPKETAREDKPLIDGVTLAEAYETLREIAASFDFDSMIFVLQSLEDYRLPEQDSQRCQALREAVRKPDWDKVNELLNK